jgi:hypothetical protein
MIPAGGINQGKPNIEGASMPSKKKSKGVLERIGNAASSAAEVALDAGSKAVHAVGDMMPSKAPKKKSKASPKQSAKKVMAKPKASASKAKKAAPQKSAPKKAAPKKATMAAKPKGSKKG